MNDIKEEQRVIGADLRPAGKREKTKATNREAILTAAREVFADLGYGATTVRDIIRRTGLASGTFYNYFKSKEEVFEALIDDSAQRIRPRLLAERIRSRTFNEFIRNAYRTYFDYLMHDRTTYEVMRRNTGALRVRMETPEVQASFEQIRQYLEEDVASGALPKVDVEYLTAAAVGIATEIGDRMIMRPTASADEAAEFAANLFMNGLSALPRKE